MNLPEELLAEILAELPVDSLVRLSCVCKAWRDLIIGDPYFAEKQLKKNKKEDPLMFIRIYHKKDSSTEDAVFSYSKRKRLLSCLRNSAPSFEAVGSCNGIVCLVEYCSGDGGGDVGEVHLYNPITREEVQLPRHNLCDKYGHRSMSFGFGVDACNKDYKVVVIGRTDVGVEIYKLSTNCWSKVCVEDEIRDIVMDSGMRGVGVVNGFYHWWSGDTFLTFDFETQMFGTIQPPDLTAYQGLQLVCTGVLDDSLAISFTNLPPTLRGMDMDVWVMTEYGNDKSWKKISTHHSDAFIVHNMWPVHGTDRLVLLGHYFANPYHHPTSIAEEGQDTPTTLLQIDGSCLVEGQTILPVMAAYFTNTAYFQPSLVSLGSPSFVGGLVANLS